MKKIKGLLLCILVLLCAASAGVYSYANEPDTTDDAENYIPDIVEYDHYTSDRPQTYASSLTGKINNIVIFISFSDTYEYVRNDNIPYADLTYNSGTNALKQYLNRISYGEIDITTYFYPKDTAGNYYSVKVSHNAEYYKKQYLKENGELSDGYTDSQRFSREKELLSEVLGQVASQLTASGINFDLNNDGYIDGISFIVPVVGVESDIHHGDLLWPHKTEAYISTDINGKLINTYNIVNMGSRNYGILGQYGQREVGTITHEFLHTLSLPDLYRYGNASAHPLGGWDIMDNGYTANITAWYQREYLEFGAKLPVYIESAEGITLSSAAYENPQEVYAVILKPSRNSNEYFVVEHRKIEEGNETKQKNSGLLVYRIIDNPSGPYSTDGNAAGPPDFIYAFRPNESAANAGDGNIEYATLSPNNPLGFKKLGKALGTETPGYDNGTIYYQDGSNSGLIIDNIRSNANGSMSFDVIFPQGLVGNGTQNSPYEICTQQDLSVLVSSTANTNYKIMNDINLEGTDFIAIPDFKGILEGNHKKIRGLKVTGAYGAAFIDYVDTSAIIKNLTFDQPYIQASDGYASIFASLNGQLENIVVNGGTISSNSRAGGLAGVLNSDGHIANCYTSATVIGNEAGGLLSYMCGGGIVNSYACGKISRTHEGSITGGLFAFWQRDLSGTLENTYWDLIQTGQNSNGLEWINNTPANVPGGYGIRIKCPDTINKSEAGKAVSVVENGMNTLSGTWASSDNSILEINESNGSFTGKAAGSATITYQFTIGGHTAVLSKNITCVDTEPPATEPATTEAPTQSTTQMPAEPTTQPPTQISTEPPTQPTTQAPTEPTTQPTTQAPTEPATQPPTTTPPATQPTITTPPATPAPPTTSGSNESNGPQYTDDIEAFVARFYVNILNRQPDPNGLKAWSDNLKSGKEQGAKVGYGFINSVEFKKRNLSDTEYIKILYRTFLNREADEGGLAAWQKVLDSGLSRLHVYRGFAESDEFTKICKKYGIQRGYANLTAPMDQKEGVTKFVVRCYRLCLRRNADEEGLNAWCSQILTAKNTAKEVAYGFIFSHELTKQNLTDSAYVHLLYRVFLDREGDPKGVQAWINVLNSGKNREHVFNGFADSVEFEKLCNTYGIS